MKKGSVVVANVSILLYRSPVVPEPEENFKSLADYQAEKEAARIAAQVNIRKPNEGVDESQWKKLTPLVKEEALDDFMFTGKVKN